MHGLEPDWQATADLPSPPPTWNLAPSQQAWVVTRAEGKLEPRRMVWGFQPTWAKPGSPKPINARAETAADKPFFNEAWRSARCVVPADCYYEWETQPKGKRPFHIGLAGNGSMLMAGLYTLGATARQGSFAVVTVAATGLLAKLHGRMPLILAADKAKAWLDTTTPTSAVRNMATASCGQELAWHAVSAMVNNPHNDGAKLVRESA